MNRRKKMKRIQPKCFVLAWSTEENGIPVRKKVKVWARHGGGVHTDCVGIIVAADRELNK